MDQKQFERLQTAVQWVVDEEVTATPSLTLNMDVWGFGEVPRDTEPTKGRYDVEREAVIPVKVVCPSACCLAGNIVLAAGDQFVVDGQYTSGETVYADNCIDEKGVIHSIPQRALELIGLDDDYEMFDGSQSAADVVEKAWNVAADRGFDLDVK
jgi:hypothetical protein